MARGEIAIHYRIIDTEVMKYPHASFPQIFPFCSLVSCLPVFLDKDETSVLVAGVGWTGNIDSDWGNTPVKVACVF